MQDANSTVTGTKVVAAKTAKAKTVKPNPSAALIGMKLNRASEITVNFRQGKGNVISCDEIECTGANATGRRLTVTFKSAGKELMTRRVYKEHFEKMADKFGVDL